jgi:tetratricopeptide (TPR) repeat protein
MAHDYESYTELRTVQDAHQCFRRGEMPYKSFVDRWEFATRSILIDGAQTPIDEQVEILLCFFDFCEFIHNWDLWRVLSEAVCSRRDYPSLPIAKRLRFEWRFYRTRQELHSLKQCIGELETLLTRQHLEAPTDKQLEIEIRLALANANILAFQLEQAKGYLEELDVLLPSYTPETMLEWVNIQRVWLDWHYKPNMRHSKECAVEFAENLENILDQQDEWSAFQARISYTRSWALIGLGWLDEAENVAQQAQRTFKRQKISCWVHRLNYVLGHIKFRQGKALYEAFVADYFPQQSSAAWRQRLAHRLVRRVGRASLSASVLIYTGLFRIPMPVPPDDLASEIEQRYAEGYAHLKKADEYYNSFDNPETGSNRYVNIKRSNYAFVSLCQHILGLIEEHRGQYLEALKHSGFAVDILMSQELSVRKSASGTAKHSLLAKLSSFLGNKHTAIYDPGAYSDAVRRHVWHNIFCTMIDRRPNLWQRIGFIASAIRQFYRIAALKQSFRNAPTRF